MSDQWEPTPVPAGDGRHDIGDETRAAIVRRLIDDWSRDPDLSQEKVRQLAMWAGASVRSLLHELGVLRDLDAGAAALRQQQASSLPETPAITQEVNRLRLEIIRGWPKSQTLVDALIEAALAQGRAEQAQELSTVSAGSWPNLSSASKRSSRSQPCGPECLTADDVDMCAECYQVLCDEQGVTGHASDPLVARPLVETVRTETTDLGGHESHGGRADLGPADPPQRSHDGNRSSDASLRLGVVGRSQGFRVAPEDDATSDAASEV